MTYKGLQVPQRDIFRGGYHPKGCSSNVDYYKGFKWQTL